MTDTIINLKKELTHRDLPKILSERRLRVVFILILVADLQPILKLEQKGYMYVYRHKSVRGLLQQGILNAFH